MKVDKEKVKQFFKSKQFISCAVIFVLAISVGIGGAYLTGRSVQKRLEKYTENYTINPLYEFTPTQSEEPTKDANKDVTGVPDERDDETQTSDVVFTTGEAIVKSEGFIFPFGKNIVKDYSDGVAVKSKTMNDWRCHNGIDFAGSEGDKAVAIQSGSVLAVTKDSLWGTVVEIDHGNGMVAKYCGIKEGTTPEKGTIIAQGDTIGTVTVIPAEKEDGIHLHLEITVSGKIVDPLKAMKLAD